MTCDQRLRADVEAAICRVDSPTARRRLEGLLQLVRLADAHAALRQPVVDVICAYLRAPAAAGGPRELLARRAARRAVLSTLREHLTDPGDPATWCGLDIDLSRCELTGDLSGIVVAGGSVRLDDARVPAGRTLDLRSVRVRGGLLSMARLEVDGLLDATGLGVDGGECSLDGLVVTDGAHVTMDGARLTDGSLWLRDGSIGVGTLSLRGMRATGGQLSLHETWVLGGELRLDDLTVDGAVVHVTAATVETGALRMDDLRLTTGLLSLAMTHVKGGRMSLDGARVDGGAVRLEGLAVDRRAEVVWGPFAPVEPVEPRPRPKSARPRDLDLRGPAPADRWSWLRNRGDDHEGDASGLAELVDAGVLDADQITHDRSLYSAVASCSSGSSSTRPTSSSSARRPASAASPPR